VLNGKMLPLMIGLSTTYEQALTQSNWNWSDYFQGSMDELKFYNIALNQVKYFGYTIMRVNILAKTSLI